MNDKEWIVIILAKRGWTITRGFKKCNDAEELRRKLLSNDIYENVIVAYNPYCRPR